MTDATELTLKQIADSSWVRRLARLSMIVLLPLVTGGGSFIGWVMYQNWQTSQQAVAAAASAAAIAETAVSTSNDVRDKQDARADLADQRARDELAWRNRLDAGLTDVQADIGEIKGAVGELKGLIVRQTASSNGGWVASPFPHEFR